MVGDDCSADWDVLLEHCEAHALGADTLTLDTWGPIPKEKSCNENCNENCKVYNTQKQK